MSQEKYPFLGFGLGLRSTFYKEALKGQVHVDWLEALSENYMGFPGSGQGPQLKKLEKVREHYPIVLHGVSLSIGGTDPLRHDYLNSLKQLVDLIEPQWVSDHLCWCTYNAHNSHDLLPLPYTKESLDNICNRLDKVQNKLGKPFLVENVSSYMEFTISEMTEWEFISEVVRRTGCGVLLDVNNVFVSSTNHHFDPMEFIEGIPKGSVGQIHLAGHIEREGILVDTHNQPMKQEVLSLYKKSIGRFGPISTLLEWDDNIPELPSLEAELDKARKEVENLI